MEEIIIHFVDGKMFQLMTCGDPESFGQMPFPPDRIHADAVYRITTDAWTNKHKNKALEKYDGDRVKQWGGTPCPDCAAPTWAYPETLRVLNLEFIRDPREGHDHD